MKSNWSLFVANQAVVSSMRTRPTLDDNKLYLSARCLVNETVGWLMNIDKKEIRDLHPNILPGIINQLGRSSTSVSANIAEGEGRTRSTGHYRQFLMIARGSLMETIDHFVTLSNLESCWSDMVNIVGANVMAERWKCLLVEFDTFAEGALDPEGWRQRMVRLSKVNDTNVDACVEDDAVFDTDKHDVNNSI